MTRSSIVPTEELDTWRQAQKEDPVLRDIIKRVEDHIERDIFSLNAHGLLVRKVGDTFRLVVPASLRQQVSRAFVARMIDREQQVKTDRNLNRTRCTGHREKSVPGKVTSQECLPHFIVVPLSHFLEEIALISFPRNYPVLIQSSHPNYLVASLIPNYTICRFPSPFPRMFTNSLLPHT